MANDNFPDALWSPPAEFTGSDRVMQRSQLRPLPAQTTELELEEGWQAGSREAPRAILDLPGFALDDKGTNYWRIRTNKLPEGELGNCYFYALSDCLYGTGKYWFWLKGQHLAYFEAVVTSDAPAHPRRAAYRRLANEAERGATLRQRLWTAHFWTPTDAVQLTCDLYGLQVLLVYRAVRGDEASPLAVRVFGARNARQVCLWMGAAQNHFEFLFPWAPGDVNVRPSEVRLPCPRLAARRDPARARRDPFVPGFPFNQDKHVALAQAPVIPVPNNRVLSHVLGVRVEGRDDAADAAVSPPPPLAPATPQKTPARRRPRATPVSPPSPSSSPPASDSGPNGAAAADPEPHWRRIDDIVRNVLRHMTIPQIRNLQAAFLDWDRRPAANEKKEVQIDAVVRDRAYVDRRNDAALPPPPPPGQSWLPLLDRCIRPLLDRMAKMAQLDHIYWSHLGNSDSILGSDLTLDQARQSLLRDRSYTPLGAPLPGEGWGFVALENGVKHKGKRKRTDSDGERGKNKRSS